MKYKNVYIGKISLREFDPIFLDISLNQNLFIFEVRKNCQEYLNSLLLLFWVIFLDHLLHEIPLFVFYHSILKEINLNVYYFRNKFIMLLPERVELSSQRVKFTSIESDCFSV